MEESNNNKLICGTPPKQPRPTLGVPQLTDKGYVVKNLALIGVIYKITCPKCGHTLLIKANMAKLHRVICKECNTIIYFIGKEHKSKPNEAKPSAEPVQKAGYDGKGPKEAIKVNKQKEKTIEVEGTKKFAKPDARLEWGSFINKHHYNIQRLGEHYIGRKDDEVRSDAVINDEYVSRRSFSIEPIPKSRNECAYKLTVKNATNPVLVNGKAFEIGESTFLNYGDTILVGNTTLIFKQGIRK